MKGQVSFEFLIITSVILFIILLIFSTASGAQLSSQESEIQKKLKNVCENIAEKINQAMYYGQGFSQEIVLPSEIYGNEYKIEVQNNETLVCSTTKFSIIEIFIENSIKNETSSPPFFIEQEKITVTNSGGKVLIK